MGRRTVFLTIDLEDYRRQELRDHRCGSEPAHPYEVDNRQLEELLEILDSINTRATFLVVGRQGACAGGLGRDGEPPLDRMPRTRAPQCTNPWAQRLRS